jgi:type III pantothenate kinase
MLLALDIGNSSIKFGVFGGDILTAKFSIPTRHDYTTDEINGVIGDRLEFPISDAIVCSVVPEIDPTFAEYLSHFLDVEPVFVRNDFDFGLKINYEPISAAGTDRLVNAFAAAEKYGVPCIVCSFGTATTIDAVNADRDYIGGIIAPGMATMAKALHLNTAKLPEVEIKRPGIVIGNSTVSSIQSGIYYGYIGLVEGIITRMTAELLSVPPAVAGGLSEGPRIISTGGFADLISREINAIDVSDSDLTLEGLRLIHQRKP